MTRAARAVDAVRDAIVTVSDLPASRIGNDDDLIDDLSLCPIELEGLGLILEEVFAIAVSEDVWRTPLNRTPSSLAEWCVRKSEEAAWAESQRQRRRA